MWRLTKMTVVAAFLVSAVVIHASPRSRPMDEDAAINLLDRTLKRDHVYARRISLDCVSYITEEATGDYFQFVLREKHDAKCGGDAETSPMIDRYRVHRRAGKIEWWQRTEDNWLPYDPAKIR